MKKIANKWIFLVISVVFISILSIFGLFYPNLPFPENMDSLQYFSLHFLAGFVFYGDKSHFLNLIIIQMTIFVVIFVYFIKFQDIKGYGKLVRSFLFVQVSCYYFFGIFCSRHSGSFWDSISKDYFIYCIIHIAILLIFSTIGPFILSRQIKSHLHGKKIESIREPKSYKCPHCGKIYHANVQYCISCNNVIHEND